LQADEVKNNFKIGLAVLKDNPDYSAGRRAFVDTLENQKDINFEFKLLDAFGDMEVYKKGIKDLVEVEKVDLIFATGTRSTIPVVELVKDIPIVFTAVAAPVRANIVESRENPGKNVTGTHCGIPEYAQLKTILTVIPSVKRIGIVYTADEPNAEHQTADFKLAAEGLGVEVLTSLVSKDCDSQEEVEQATNKLVGKVDVLVAHQDTSLSRYGRGMIKVAEENNIPAYVSLSQLLSEGALFSLGIDFSELGKISAKQAIRVLKHQTDPGGLPVETYKKYSLTINLPAAEKIGLKLPVQVLRKASKLIK